MNNTQTNTLATAPTIDLDKPTAQEILFSNYVAKGYSFAQAYRQAFPDQVKKLKDQTIRKYAYELSTKFNIVTEITHQRDKLASLANKAINRLDDVITDGKEHNALAASIFVIEQTQGKAIQKIENKSAHVLVTYNLGGKNTPPVPQDILDQLDEIQ